MGSSPTPRVRPHIHAINHRLHSPLNPVKTMTLLSIVITLIVVGLALWLINNFIPMDRKIKGILNFVVVAAVILWLLYGLDILNGSGEVNMPVIR